MAVPGPAQDSTDDLSTPSLRSRASSIVTTTTKFSLETLSQDDRSSLGPLWEMQRQGNADRPRSLLSMTSIARPAPPYHEAGDSMLLLPSHREGFFQTQPNMSSEAFQHPAEAISINEALPPSPTRSEAATPSPDSPVDIEANMQSRAAYYSSVVRTLDQNYTAAVEALRQQHAQQLALTRHDIDQAYRAQWKAKNREIERIREETATAKEIEVLQLRTDFESKFERLQSQVIKLQGALLTQAEEAAEKERKAVEKARHEVEDVWERRWQDRTKIENDEKQKAELQAKSLIRKL
ncbi:MAG: hypothetical protein Q9220_004697 [cf. Caloplaca sp. 1 TL-2023]